MKIYRFVLLLFLINYAFGANDFKSFKQLADDFKSANITLNNLFPSGEFCGNKNPCPAINPVEMRNLKDKIKFLFKEISNTYVKSTQQITSDLDYTNTKDKLFGSNFGFLNNFSPLDFNQNQSLIMVIQIIKNRLTIFNNTVIDFDLNTNLTKTMKQLDELIEFYNKNSNILNITKPIEARNALLNELDKSFQDIILATSEIMKNSISHLLNLTSSYEKVYSSKFGYLELFQVIDEEKMYGFSRDDQSRAQEERRSVYVYVGKALEKCVVRCNENEKEKLYFDLSDKTVAYIYNSLGCHGGVPTAKTVDAFNNYPARKPVYDSSLFSVKLLPSSYFNVMSVPYDIDPGGFDGTVIYTFLSAKDFIRKFKVLEVNSNCH